ncbi:MAG: hypothetical protein HF976_14455 [ANME-2 cluster archaeon]|nr:hypothetical protein [ANME-2 cluster archaeon]MBC2702575.1 hypothetical protein [ANME-2 cluster archaeon]MBC2708161.1 hypothetical protein [ANME-2 cluster archaeon]MBC2745535.1 hypothetical protein [ANME-2 cluster archaeon]
MSRINGYTQEWNKVLKHLMRMSDFPIWIEDEKNWKTPGMRAMKAYVETLEGKRLPIKWVWKEILGPFGIIQQDLSTSQIELFFKNIGFSTGSYGRSSK